MRTSVNIITHRDCHRKHSLQVDLNNTNSSVFSALLLHYQSNTFTTKFFSFCYVFVKKKRKTREDVSVCSKTLELKVKLRSKMFLFKAEQRSLESSYGQEVFVWSKTAWSKVKLREEMFVWSRTTKHGIMFLQSCTNAHRSIAMNPANPNKPERLKSAPA